VLHWTLPSCALCFLYVFAAFFFYSSSMLFFRLFSVFEFMLHYIHVLGMNDSELWTLMSPGDTLASAYFATHTIYMKFLIIWRMFRLAGCIEGVDSPENMPHCINNGTTFQDFWRFVLFCFVLFCFVLFCFSLLCFGHQSSFSLFLRNWHSSFNKWATRYMYIPMGGRKYQKFTVR